MPLPCLASEPAAGDDAGESARLVVAVADGEKVAAQRHAARPGERTDLLAGTEAERCAAIDRDAGEAAQGGGVVGL